MSQKRKILMLTNSEHGQANVFLATSRAILAIDPNVEIHIASFKAIRSAVTATSAAAVSENAKATPIAFHEIHGMSSHDAWLENPGIGAMRLLSISPGFWTTPRILSIISRASMPYTGPQLVQNCREVRRVVEEVRPDLAVVDNLFAPGLTVVRQMGISYMILSPNTLKDLAGPLQPLGAIFWKYPCVGTAFPFPVPWHLIPLNIFYLIVLIFFMVLDKNARDAQKHVTEKLGTRIFSTGELISNPPKNLKMLSASSPEFDFPVDNIPDNILPCGPIVRQVPPVSEVDPELHNWLARGPTVFINLGSLSWTTEDQAVEIAHAIRVLFSAWQDSDEEGRLQVLWKLKQSPDGQTKYDVRERGCRVESILGSAFDNDVVRVVGWVAAEPYAVLQTGHIICSVNHGGANSFWEALCVGVPQVVLPAWGDTYDFAHRADFLGIGRWGSRTSAPSYRAEELGDALRQVAVGHDAKKTRERAREIANKRLQQGEGRMVAAKHILGAL